MNMRAQYIRSWLMWPRVVYLLSIIAWSTTTVFVVHWIQHREPPFEMSMFDYQEPEGAPGDVITFKTPVKRDIDRKCSATYNKELLTANGNTQKIDDGELSANAIALRDRLTPGMLRDNFIIPQLPPGRTLLIVDTRYRCLSNPSTWFFPIDVTTVRPFNVLPPRPAVL